MWESLRTVRAYLWRYRRGLALGLGALVLKDVAGAAQPLMIRAAIDALSRAHGLVRLLRFAGLPGGPRAVKGLFQYWMRVIIIGISRDIEYDLRNDLFRHLVALSPDYLRPHPHRRHHGARHQRPERRPHDARARASCTGPRPASPFLLAIVIMLSRGLAADAAGAACPRRWSASR